MFPFSSQAQAEVHHEEIVVNDWQSWLGVARQCSKETSGRMLRQERPQSGIRAPGVPTVSPVVKYTSCCGTVICPVLIQVCSRPGSKSTKAVRRKRDSVAGSI